MTVQQPIDITSTVADQWSITAYRCTCHNIRWAYEPVGATWRPGWSDGVFETGPTVPIYLTLEALSEDHTLHPIAVDNVEALLNTHLATVQQFEDYVEAAIEERLPEGGEWATWYAHADHEGFDPSSPDLEWVQDVPGVECVEAGCVQRSVWFGPVESVPTSDTTEATP